MARANRTLAVTVGLWTWRRSILRSSLSPEARLVLLAISFGMLDTSGFVFSALRNLVADTGLPTGTVRGCLHEAFDAGFVDVLEIEPGYFQVTRRS